MNANVPILLVHGLGDTARLFGTMSAYLAKDGRKVHCVNLEPNDGEVGLEQLATQIQSYVAERFAPAPKFDLLGFSMGGIVSRYYVQRLGGIERVRRFVTISSPHRGTWTAWLQGNAGIRQMRPNSKFLGNLNRDCGILAQAGFVSIWTPFDLMIVPARSSVLPVGRSIQVGVLAHPLMVNDREVLRVVEQVLTEPA